MLNNKGSTLIFVVSLAIILNIVFLSIYYSVGRTQKASGTKRVQTSALTLAEAGKEKLYGEITQLIYKPTANTRTNIYTNYAFGNGSFSVNCSSNVTLDTVWIESSGKENLSQAKISVVASITPDVTINAPAIRGAVMARSSILINGNINVDGRDHDTTGAVIDSGVYGVSTCNLLYLSGSSSVGGNGIAPVDKNNIGPVQTLVSEQNAPVLPLFQSPEAFLGLPAGALDKYVAPSLTTPMKGIVYLKNSYVGPVHFDSSYGILIVHNSARNAELQITDGFFKGVIITDLMAKINGDATVLGAVITLNDGEMSTFGIGSADIFYSSYVLNNLAKYCLNIKKKVKEVSWKEVK